MEICSNCGHASPALQGGTVYCEVSDTDEVALRALASGEIEHVSCEACGHHLPVTPSVIFISESSGQVKVFTAPSVPPDNVLKLVSDRIRGSAEIVPTLVELQQFVFAHIKQHAPALNGLMLSRIQGKQQEYLKEHWRKLTPTVFTAFRVASQVAIPGVQIARTHGPGEGATIEQYLADAQYSVWYAMCEEWANSGGGGNLLEKDLRVIFDRGPVLPGVAERFQVFAVKARHAGLAPRPRYVVEAMSATLYVRMGQKNPYENDWAIRFFNMELAAVREESGNAASLLISESRARATISHEAAVTAVLSCLGRDLTPAEKEHLWQIAAKAGNGEVRSVIMERGFEVKFKEGTDPVETVISLLRTVAKDFPGQWIPLPHYVVKPILDRHDVEGLERIASVQIDLMGGGYEAQARADHWLGGLLNQLKQPARYLARIGEVARKWEHTLPRDLCSALWTERSNHLRLLGRYEDALAWARAAHALIGDQVTEENARVNRHNLAILLRKTGSPDLALKELELLEADAKGGQRIGVLLSKANTYNVLGDREAAERCLDQALELARGPWADEAIGIRASRANFRAAAGRFEAAIEDLRGIGAELDRHPAAVPPAIASWLLVLRHGGISTQDALREIAPVFDKLREIAYGDTPDVLRKDALTMFALAATQAGIDGAEQGWADAYAYTEERKQAPDNLVLIEMAQLAYRRGRNRRARRFLARLPQSVAAAYGGVTEIAIAAGGPTVVEESLQSVARLAFEEKLPWEDVRLIAEMARDVIGRARRARANPEMVKDLREGIGSNLLARVTPQRGAVAVVEWLESDRELRGLVTIVASSKKLRTNWLGKAPCNLAALGERVRSRLNSWTRSRRGDPLDLPEWREAEEWITKELCTDLSEGDHVVVIDHKSLGGLPWHLLLRSRWSCSYTSGWQSLLSMRDRPTSWGRLGVALVPRFHDSAEVEAALARSAENSKALAHRVGAAWILEQGVACDQDAARSVLAGSDVVKFLCHGFVSAADKDVGLMVAHNSTLPLGQSSPLAKLYRFGRHEASSLARSAPLVFSAACSSGMAHVVGTGERIGFFSVLNEVGTRTLVAPHWDVFPQFVLPALDAALERVITTGNTIAQCVREACLDAERRAPVWLAWSIGLEGDWR